MGTNYMICAAHLAAIVRDLASNAQNEAVTVKTVENLDWEHSCAYCDAPAEFEASYHPKK